MIDKNKVYKTRDGREVRIYATDGGVGASIHGAIKTKAGWSTTAWGEHGNYWCGEDHDNDLIEVQPRHKRAAWINVNSDHHDVYAYSSRTAADKNASKYRIACIKVDLDFEEGEGL
ncbi:hypothetical protein UFOVP231_64 [uncultured Caudovirales phage]|uniref:Uncharacterized protein n=1 Tax=uncultured Caudovirales phage TaxID=2100421 RepID=A0A6J7WTJ0_9CAUD|nr:hypothetical protein UFOVP231_64 [uncultured Caudovirales phage]